MPSDSPGSFLVCIVCERTYDVLLIGVDSGGGERMPREKVLVVEAEAHCFMRNVGCSRMKALLPVGRRTVCGQILHCPCLMKGYNPHDWVALITPPSIHHRHSHAAVQSYSTPRDQHSLKHINKYHFKFKSKLKIFKLKF